MAALEAKNKGNEAFTNKKYDEAAKWFTEAINLDPSNHVLYSNRSGAYAALGKYQDALQDAQKTTSIKSDWAKGYSRTGAALFGLGRLDEAEQAYSKAVEMEPNNAQFKEGLSDVRSAKSERSNQGEADIGQLFGQAFSGDIFTKLRLNPQTSAFLSQPDFLAKITEIQQNPQSITKHLQDKRVMAALSVLMGVNIQTPGGEMPEEPAPPKSAEKPKQPEPKKEEPKPKKEEPKPAPMEVEKNLTGEQKQAEAEKQKGNDAYKAKKFDEAIAHYTKAIQLDPANVVYLTNRAAAYFEKGNYQECIQDCEKSIEEGRAQRVDYKQLAKAFTRIGNAYMKMKNLEAAIEAYQHSLAEERTPQTQELLKKAQKQKEEADKLAYLDPAKSIEHKEKGNEHFKQGRFPEAIKEYTEAMKRNPDDHVLYSNRAACYTKLAEYHLGLKDCDDCIARNPKFVKAYSRKGTILFFLKDYQKALQAYDEGLKLDENNQELVEGINRTLAAMQKANSQESDKDRLERAMQDPEVQEILSDPVMRQILQDMQTNPEAARNHMKSPLVAQKIQKLINAGILR